ncbi:DUF3320 domain-containing protein [Pseudobythopirellula maris]|uniref:DUF3320 domain-containing protein n=1 Tax=Pseudobythopirellula maris TaxID=2527991 RepID=UPI0018D28F9C|nr:DUF3320 domain-containing protein [Pseudobythopirellula maris]
MSEREGSQVREEVNPWIVATVEQCFNYAAWQNAIPLLRSVVVHNPTGEDLESVIVELTTSPAFVRPKSWIIDRIGAGQQISLSDVDIEVDADYLDSLDEAIRGVLVFRLRKGEQSLAETCESVRVLARDEWGGMGGMGELLPAFVTPNEPALSPLLKSTAEILSSHGHPAALDGYQSGDPNRSYMLAAALWSAVAARSLTYANPPGSFEQVGQKTRRVTTVLGDGLATCLDTSLLFASGLEAIGLHPVVLMTEGHCFAGVWLTEKTFNRLCEPDCSEVRKALSAKELVVFETTLVTHVPAAKFADAIRAAEAKVSEACEHEFVAAVDVARARMSQIRPLASHGARDVKPAQEAEGAGPPALPDTPGYERPLAEQDDPLPQTPAGRVERWQRKLLDLSLRNKLLNFRPNKQTIPVLCPNVSRLEDLLADGSRMRLVSLNEHNAVVDRDPALHQQRTRKDLDLEFASEALERGEVACPIESHDLEKRLTALFRKVKNDLAEGGCNTLYLAVGFLRWKQTPTAEKTYRAPLLLVPVKLLRRSASSPFYFAHHEDDVRFNATLLQLLKKDFDCDLTAMESDLPTDDSGIDVPRVLDRMRRAVRDIPGFEVVEEATVASFSFAKYLMWKDLVDRVDQLERNRVVRHLVNEPDKAFARSDVGPIPRPHEIDTRYEPSDLFHPLPADSSQLTAVMAVSEGHDLVIIGPPGTGKSQTIANLIAQCLAVGKTVLFVAEKTAALDVVHRRLRQHGLGDCCVELHSNKAERRRLLDQLEVSWKRPSRQGDREWIAVNDSLRLRRDELNAYVAALHAVHPNGWTAYRAMGVCADRQDSKAVDLGWSRDRPLIRDDYETLRKSVDEIIFDYVALPDNADLGRMQAAEWSMAWEEDFLATCGRLKESSDSLADGVGQLSKAIGLPLSANISAAQLGALYRLTQELLGGEQPAESLVLHEKIDELKALLAARRELLERRERSRRDLNEALSSFAAALGAPPRDQPPEDAKPMYYRLANELVKPDPPPAPLVFHAAFDSLPEQLTRHEILLKQRADAWEMIDARRFNPSLVKRIRLDEIEAAWLKAVGSIWPLSLLRRRSVTKKLKAYMPADATAEPDIDLPLLREHLDSQDLLAENHASMALPQELQLAVDQDPPSLRPPLEAARRLRDAFVAAESSPERVGEANRQSLEPLIAAARRLYPPGRVMEQLRIELQENMAALDLPPDLQAEVLEDGSALDSQLEAAGRLREIAATLGLSNASVAGLQASLTEEGRQSASDCRRSAKDFQNAWQEYARLAEVTPVPKASVSVVRDAAEQAERVLSNRSVLNQWIAWTAARRRAETLGLAPFVASLQRGEFTVEEAASRFEHAYARWWLPLAVDQSDALRKFQRIRHEDAIKDFCQLDESARKAAAPRAVQAIYHGLPASEQVPRKSELGLLRHQIGLKRPSKSIRELISGMPETFSKLAPCLMMSPLSIAQYLPADQAPFDVVVFDEASQIATWDAIGAIARGKQTIIVGDPKQLPPTNFFGKADDDEDNAELEDYEKDLASILDEAHASGLPELVLNWHYRSRHESLIAFSNHHYYGDGLVTFPAAESEDRGVSLIPVAGGLYDRGKSRTNRAEAEAIVADAVERMRRCLARPEGERLTYGVVTFNSQQQALIQDLFDQALRDAPELEWFFADDRVEPTAVKNLENVQGDERDVMYFSITFGKDAAGKFPVDFGAINREGGERRLNVAVTRARQALRVFASFLPDELRADRSKARGVHDLKAFLEYAHKGPETVLAATIESTGDAAPCFEQAVSVALESRGWSLTPGVGVSGFRVDLGVVHPDRPEAYLAGIECDGAAYLRAAAARDRDKTRQQVLENLGWNILRVWSPDWWRHPDAAIDDLHNRLTSLLQASREGDRPSSTPANEDSPEGLQAFTPPRAGAAGDDLLPPVNYTHEIADAPATDDSRHPRLVAKQASNDKPRKAYVITKLDDRTADQDRFYDDEYSRDLRELALAIVETEGPIRDDVLARRIARAHGFARTGARIRDRVLAMIPEVTSTKEEAGRFLWPSDKPAATAPFRHAAPEDERRSLDEIPMAELIGLVSSRPDLTSSDDPAIAFAREIGLSRLAKSARERLETAIELAGGVG